MALVERMSNDGKVYSSEVVQVVSNSASDKLGIKPGYIVIGVNNEAYISHAHTVAALKYSKRPLIVRFLCPAIDS